MSFGVLDGFHVRFDGPPQRNRAKDSDEIPGLFYGPEAGFRYKLRNLPVEVVGCFFQPVHITCDEATQPGMRRAKIKHV
jgi:hypothetical protein